MPDTIAAVATARGTSALGVVRVSGEGAGEVLLRLVPSLAGELPAPRVARYAEVCDPDTLVTLDRGVVTWYPGPGSYTGEDAVEFSVHGGVLIPDLVLDACVRAGARVAEPGEFTRRAYLNGKLDLIQVEAVADLVASRSEAQRRAALAQSEGGLSRRLTELREGLVGLEALLAYHVDFPEEDEPPVPISRIVAEGVRLRSEIEALLRTAPEGELLREGALAVLAGRPNSGKSSLLNALVGESRVIVSEEPGTTRDAVEVELSVGGYPFRLIDTAGIREGVGPVEEMGIEVARRYLSGAHIVLLCVPTDEDPGEAEREFRKELPEGVPVVPLRTKADLGTEVRVPETGWTEDEPWIRVSTLTGEGIDTLRLRMRELVFRGLATESPELPLITRRRQRQGLAEAEGEVAAFVAALQGSIPAEVAAAHLRSAESALEELLGVIGSEDVLDRVFRDFCIGK